MTEKRTVLYERHKSAGAKFISFAGWEMPAYYKGINEEHMNVRESAGLFDVSHMDDIWIEGEDATLFLQKVFTMDPGKAKPGDCVYTHVLDVNGNIIDDMIATKFADTKYFCMPNASMSKRIIAWFEENHQNERVELTNISDNYSCLALQGPKAESILQALVSSPLKEIKFFKARLFNLESNRLVDGPIMESSGPMQKGTVMISRTGYTGEDGFELVSINEDVKKLWDLIIAAGEKDGIAPIGLGARDTLRLEKGFLLSGIDFAGNRSSLETGWGDFVVSWDHDFVGKEALEEQKARGHDKLRGIILEKRGIPRTGMEVFKGEEKVGVITSGGFSPILQKGIALAYLSPDTKKGDDVSIDIRGRKMPAQVVKTPFVK